MSKKTLKIIAMVAIVLAIVSAVSFSFAATNPKDIAGKEVDQFDDLGKTIVGALQAIGSITAVAILVVLGIKYMMGSAEEKADYKKTMIPYLIGAVIIFAAPNIAGFVYNFSTNNITNNAAATNTNNP